MYTAKPHLGILWDPNWWKGAKSRADATKSEPAPGLGGQGEAQFSHLQTCMQGQLLETLWGLVFLSAVWHQNRTCLQGSAGLETTQEAGCHAQIRF